jgi:hypothetical protein
MVFFIFLFSPYTMGVMLASRVKKWTWIISRVRVDMWYETFKVRLGCGSQHLGYHLKPTLE